MTAKTDPEAAGSRRDLVITRIFDAPRALVGKAWTDPAHVMRWWGPKGSEIEILRLETEPGGAFLYSMKGIGRSEMLGPVCVSQRDSAAAPGVCEFL